MKRTPLRTPPLAPLPFSPAWNRQPLPPPPLPVSHPPRVLPLLASPNSVISLKRSCSVRLLPQLTLPLLVAPYPCLVSSGYLTPSISPPVLIPCLSPPHPLSTPLLPVTPSSILLVSLTKQSSAVSSPHQAPATPTLLFLSTTSCHTLIHPPRALTKQLLPVSPSHQAPATTTLLFLSTTSCHTLIHPPRALTKQSLAVSPSHQAPATATPLFLSTIPRGFPSLGVCSPRLRSSVSVSSPPFFS